MFKHILIPTDGSSLSEKAAEAGIKLAKSLDAEVTGFFAFAEYQIPSFAEATMPEDAPAKFIQQAKKTAEKSLAVIERLAKKAGVAYQGYCTSNNQPYQAIIETAKMQKCDLIYMASHARTGIAGVLIGSETNKVLSHSKIPVLVYR